LPSWEGKHGALIQGVAGRSPLENSGTTNRDKLANLECRNGLQTRQTEAAHLASLGERQSLNSRAIDKEDKKPFRGQDPAPLGDRTAAPTTNY